VLSSNPTGGGLDGIPDIQLAQIGIPTTSRGNQYNLRLDFIRRRETRLPSAAIARAFSERRLKESRMADRRRNITTSRLTR